MKNIHSNPNPQRQKFIEYLTLNHKAERTVHCYVSCISSLSKFYKRSAELLGADEIKHWLSDKKLESLEELKCNEPDVVFLRG